MQNYDGSPSNPVISALHKYSLPEDAKDVASVTTVNPTAKSMANDIHFMMRAGASNRPHIAMRCSDGVNIDVFAHAFIYVFNGTKWVPQFKPINFSVVPGPLAPGIWSYIYLTANNVDISNPTYVVSQVTPDAQLVFQSPADTTRRYIGSFVTDALGKVSPFTMLDYDYKFALPRDTNFSAAPYTGPGVADVTPAGLSPLAKAITVTLESKLTTAIAGGNRYFITLFPKEIGGDGTTGTWQGYRHDQVKAGMTANSLDDTDYYTAEYPLFASQKLSINQTIAGVTGFECKVWYTGFKE